jgi:hypothetical protein
MGDYFDGDNSNSNNYRNVLKLLKGAMPPNSNTLNSKVLNKLSKISKLKYNITRKEKQYRKNKQPFLDAGDYYSLPLKPRKLFNKQSKLHTHKSALIGLQRKKQEFKNRNIPFIDTVSFINGKKPPFPFHGEGTVCTLVIVSEHEEAPIPNSTNSTYTIAEEHHYQHIDLVTQNLQSRPKMCKGLMRPYIGKALEKCWFFLYISTPSNPVEGIVIINDSNDDKKIKIDILCGSDTYSGIGHYLLGVVRDIAFRIGQDTLLLDSVSDALKFYEKEDFKPCAGNSNARHCVRMSKPVANITSRQLRRQRKTARRARMARARMGQILESNSGSGSGSKSNRSNSSRRSSSRRSMSSRGSRRSRRSLSSRGSRRSRRSMSSRGSIGSRRSKNSMETRKLRNY